MQSKVNTNSSADASNRWESVQFQIKSLEFVINFYLSISAFMEFGSSVYKILRNSPLKSNFKFIPVRGLVIYCSFILFLLYSVYMLHRKALPASAWIVILMHVHVLELRLALQQQQQLSWH